MTRVYGMHEIELHPGVNEEEFENFFLKEMATSPMYPGWRVQLLKGDRGARKGKYLVLFDIESLESRDRFSAAPNESSKEADRFEGANEDVLEPLFQKWNAFSPTNIALNPNYTDYILLDQ